MLELYLSTIEPRKTLTLDIAINRLKGGYVDVYEFLDEYAKWLDKKGLKPKTQRGLITIAKKLLRYFGVEIRDEIFREKVILPRPIQVMDESLTKEQIKRIVLNSNMRMKALILFLSSSGLRLGEALALRVKDVDFDSNPVRVVIPAQYTKTNRSRESYITDEAKDALKELLGDRISNPETLLFGFGDNPHMAEKKAIQMFRRVMEKMPDYNKTIEGSRIHKIHLHSFRKFFFSSVVGLIGETAAHALMGHGSYLDTYYRRPLEERRKDYLKCVRNLTILEAGPTADPEAIVLESVKAVAEAAGIDTNAMVEKLAQRLGREPSIKEVTVALQGEIRRLIRTPSVALEQKYEHQYTREETLPKLLNEGWEILKEFKNGRILVRRPVVLSKAQTS